MAYFVYILAGRKHGTLYVGVTNDLARRLDQHRRGDAASFTHKHNVTRLVFAEAFHHVDEAIAMEKRLKKWRRSWKIQLIEKSNPDWLDLSVGL
ncbi:GIY-YIG nuclease family protein [Roseibium denhamense]|uniref:Endonuclease n=1 Tax=Roseibium denhamense TaxID=76305 RepID=A0ABY1PN33_9HYPH|nr:GIY-YIG nuclease family protein [Roseibium denhamense]MTI05702.1 GIY-YIG nuclease family protein [Roseibium denhamense]SMP36913.1 putative endonuclease [Roseibium denhamense]